MSQSIDPLREEDFQILQTEGKQLAAEGKLKESLQKFELAKEICPTAKILRRIEKLKECLKVVTKDSMHNGSTLSASCVSNDLCSKGIPKFPPNVLNTHQNASIVPKVLSDIQNVQASNAPHATRKSTDLSPISQSKFKELKKCAKESAYAGRYDDALEYFQKALTICECPNVKRYMQEIQSVISSNNEEMLKTEDVLYSTNKQESSSTIVQESVHSSEFNESDLEKKLAEVKVLYEKARVLAADGKLADSLKLLKEAQSIHKTQKVQKQINKLESVITSNDEEMLKTEDVLNSRKKRESSSTSVQESIQNLESNESDLEKKLSEVKVLYDEARDLAADGSLVNALKLLKKAQLIHETQKVQKKINKLEELISTDLNDSESNQMIKITDEFSVFHDIYNKLYPYQREGVAWMWKLYKMGKGGVLGDDMGLGKTFQVIAFISGMIDADLVKHVLIIMPVSLLQNWTKEFKKWCPGILVHEFHGCSKKERERNLLRVQKRGHVLLTSYGMILNNVNSMIEMDGREFVWDYVILDEGHKIKNPTKTTKAVYEIPSKNRLVLTGTPIQNNLRELWSLYDFVQQGTLLGSAKTFKMQFENPITRSREKDATSGEKRLGTEMAENLKCLINPFFLRRTKDEIWGKKPDNDIEQLEDCMEKLSICKLTAKKNDFILWTYMSRSQIEIYTSFLHSSAVKSILVSKRSPLVELTTLKKICDHPRLLSQRACIQLGLNGDLQNEDLLRELDDESTMASSIDNVSDETLIHESGKLKLVIELLENLKETGHRTLVFSLSRKILDMIHRILVNRNWKVMRLDGTVSKTEERERRIQRFQNDPSYPVFLLTTQVGGVGITLTSADRVIIYDPSWNPATDAQAVDRAYRIGQEKDVIVYRLITCGSVEEKIYRRQIFKDSITKQATGVVDPYRYFSKQELRELFSLDNPLYSATQVQLSEMHSSLQHTNDKIEEHIKYLQTLNIFGISHHDLMFTKCVQDDTEDNDESAVSEKFIQKQVATAKELIQLEASVVAEGIRMAGTYRRPYQEPLPLPKKAAAKDFYKPPVLPEVIDLTENAQDIFLSSKEKSLEESKIHKEYIKTHSPDSGYQNVIPFNEAQSSFRAQTKIENLFSDEKERRCSIAPKDSNNFPLKGVVPDLSVKMVESSSFAPLNTSIHIEKLRKSLHSIEPSFTLQDEVLMDGNRNLDITSDKNTSMNLDKKQSDQNKEACDDVLSVSLERSASGDLEPLKLQGNFTLKYDDLQDLSFDPEVSDRYVKSCRKSCVRKSTLFISDSESSYQSSKSDSTIDFVNDSEDDDTRETCDSPNSASLSFVPDSTPNTPDTAMLPKVAQFVSETPPPRVFSFESESNTLKSENSSFPRKLDGNVRRITPLKVDKNQTPQNSSFAQAMATSCILTPHTSPVKIESKLTSVSPKNMSCISSKNVLEASSFDDNDSPIKCVKKKKRPLPICSDSSEDSDNERDDLGLFPRKNNSNNRLSCYSSHSNTKDLLDDGCNDSEKYSSAHGDHSNIKDLSDDESSDSEHSNAPNDHSNIKDLSDDESSDSKRSNAPNDHSNIKALSDDESSDSEHSNAPDDHSNIKNLSDVESSDSERSNAPDDHSNIKDLSGDESSYSEYSSISDDDGLSDTEHSTASEFEIPPNENGSVFYHDSERDSSDSD